MDIGKEIKDQRSFFAQRREFNFFIEDEEITVKTDDLPPETSLNYYIRQKLHLTGTKYMCNEGGCGACVVAVTVTDPTTNCDTILAVNSCLVPIYVCEGWRVHTIESIGNEKKGYHPIQKALVQFNGTQCGYCTSGMLMNMFPLYELGDFTMEQVENSFAGNICRCTGYRPILSAFKSLASDATPAVLGSYADIEDIKICERSGKRCFAPCASKCSKKSQPHFYSLQSSKWYKVYSIDEILDVFMEAGESSYQLVSGNSAKGVYPLRKEVDFYIDITCVKALLEHRMEGDHLVIGANMTLTNAMHLFCSLATQHKQFSYLQKLADHIDLVATVSVRNVGTLAGNLFTKHEHHEFPSDLFLILETVGAQLTLVGVNRNQYNKNLVDFLRSDMNKVVIKNIILPALDETYRYESYKIMPRAQNAHALIHAGFLLKLRDNSIVTSARLVFGPINPNFIHAKMSEEYLIGKQLFKNDTIQRLFHYLDLEIKPNHVLPDPSPEYRKKVAISLTYKFILSIAPESKLLPNFVSGRSKFVRPVSTGTQDYETNESLYPLTQAIPKIEALSQSTGQAKYIMDTPDYPNQLYAALVLAKAPANSTILEIDPKEAMGIKGVVAYLDKNDIPGRNSFTPKEASFMFVTDEEIFCSGHVEYYHQPIGMIVANSQYIAEKAAELVNVTYKRSSEKPLLTIRDILSNNRSDRIKLDDELKATRLGEDVKHVIKGRFDASTQYHYTMETQCCVAVPEDDELTLFPSAQSVTMPQVTAAVTLNIPANKINVIVRRLGGGYGAKISRNSIVSCAAAIAAYKLKKPIKLSLPLTTNMNIIGKRLPCSMDYDMGVDDTGTIQYLNASLYSDLGYAGNESLGNALLNMVTGNFEHDTWNMKIFSTKTDTPQATFCRAPGTTEALATSVSLMNHIAVSLNIDPVTVYQNNFDKQQPNLSKYLNDLMEWANVESRRKDIMNFNLKNRWVKKGIAVVPMGYFQILFGNWNVYLSVYQSDGTVAITHGGIEMGQGINTKVAQVCAHALGIPLNHIVIKPTNTTISPNALVSGGSLTSEAVCYAVSKACEELKQRMEVVKQTMDNPNWLELVQACYMKDVSLTTTFMFSSSLPDVNAYHIYGATCAEVQIDVLTGQHNILRVDLIEDTGNSMSPHVDIGQVEGAFMMGVGYWTSEEIIYNPEGELATNRTWNYKPPGVKDIPIDFRVKFPKKNPNPLGIFFSKATGEPPLCMSCCVPLAIRNAVAAARTDSDATAEKWYPFDGPSTVENTFLNCLNDYKQYKL
ncbi:hypothetical protein PPYR_05771 [Photinus pyralis]|uniref:Indole-3-acetaldehyde oxidase n=2 Tax=Photinus pyralis TaxID=7054 RepID=A0A5N4AVS1_PHOPY|nr:xanthine dehydrogenase-like isoform X1 [Photinus pyralis]XP_031335991.1 xanthine dehydrogenase-like isoform X1 [Photinus pyralis]KAB0801417.1 hypothetical protein PPYR_05771 [Photinus pyralis]